MRTRQPRKVIWDMINTLFVATEAVEPTCFPLVLTNICPWPNTILSNFFEEQCPQSHPQYLSGLSRALFPTTFLDLPPVLTSPQSRLCNRPPFVKPPPLRKKSEKGCSFFLKEERPSGLGAYNLRPNGSRLKGVYYVLSSAFSNVSSQNDPLCVFLLVVFNKKNSRKV